MKYYYFPLATALTLNHGLIINNLNLFKFKFWQQHKGVVSWIYSKHSLKRDNSVGE